MFGEFAVNSNNLVQTSNLQWDSITIIKRERDKI